MDNRSPGAFSTERLETSMAPIRDGFWEKVISLHTFESMETGNSSRRGTGVRSTRTVNPNLVLDNVAESPEAENSRLGNAHMSPGDPRRPSDAYAEDEIAPSDSRSVGSNMSRKSAIPNPLKLMSNFSKKSAIEGQNPPPVPKLSEFPSTTSLPKHTAAARPDSQAFRHSLITEVPKASPTAPPKRASKRSSHRSSKVSQELTSVPLTALPAIPAQPESEPSEASEPKGNLPVPPNLHTTYNPRVSSPPHPGVRPLGKNTKSNALMQEMRRLSIPASDIMYPTDVYASEQSNRQRATFRDIGQEADNVESAEEGHPTSYDKDAVDSGPPDGGTLAWLIALAGLFGTFNSWGLNTAFGVFQAYYSLVTLYGMPLDKISWIGSMQLFFIFFVGTPVGFFMDKGWFRVFFNGGSVLIVVGLFLTSICTKWWQFLLVQGVLTGFGMGLMFTSGVIVLLTWFRRNIGVAMGVAAAGTSFGAIVYTLTFQRLILLLSFGWTVRVMAFIALATLIYPNAIVRPRVQIKSAGLNRRLQRALCAYDAGRKSPQEDPAAPKLTLRMVLHALNDPPYLLTTFGFFLAFWSLYLAFYYMPIYAYIHLHTSPTTSLNILLAMSAANLPGRFLPGILSDRCMGPLNTLIPACFLSGACLFLWTEVSTYGAMMVVACFYGFCCAGVQALYAAALASFTTGLGNDDDDARKWRSCLGSSAGRRGRKKNKASGCTGSTDCLTGGGGGGGDLEKQAAGLEKTLEEARVNKQISGLKSGVVFTAISFACLTGSPIGGKLIQGTDDQGSFLGLQLFAGASFCGGALMLLAARWAKVGWAAGKT